MKLIPVMCPKCGAQIQINEGTKTCYCTYCGTQIIIDEDGAKVTYRKVDEARIKEADVKQILALKEMEIEEKKRQDRKIALIALSIASGVMFVLALIVGHSNGITGILLGAVALSILMWGVQTITDGNNKKEK